jgi:Flp pilus assembly protein TadD
MGRTEDAVRAFEQARALRPDAPEPMTGIAQSYLAADKSNEAIAALRKATAAAPQDAFVRNLLGEVLSRGSRPDEAEAAAAFREAIALKGDWFVPYLNLGNMLEANGKSAEGRAVLRQGLERIPGNETLLFALAGAEERTGNPEAAVPIYERILSLRPQSEVAANNLAAILADLRKSDRVALERAFALAKPFETSDNPFYLDTLGWVLYRRGDPQQARLYLERAIGIRADVPVIQYHLGMVLAQLGEARAAEAALARAVIAGAAYPGLDEARAMLALLREKTSQVPAPAR